MEKPIFTSKQDVYYHHLGWGKFNRWVEPNNPYNSEALVNFDSNPSILIKVEGLFLSTTAYHLSNFCQKPFPAKGTIVYVSDYEGFKKVSCGKFREYKPNTERPYAIEHNKGELEYFKFLSLTNPLLDA